MDNQELQHPAGGLPAPHPDEALIESQNARRLGRRRQAAALALEVDRVDGSDLDRFGERRVVGGTFESLQAVPEREVAQNTQLSMADIMQFLSGLSFDPSQETLGLTQFQSSFGPNILGLNTSGLDQGGSP